MTVMTESNRQRTPSASRGDDARRALRRFLVFGPEATDPGPPPGVLPAHLEPFRGGGRVRTEYPLFLGPLVLILNTSAYAAEIFYGALRTVPKGEVEAALSMGMNRRNVFRSVTWPNMLRLAWPAYTNEMVFSHRQGGKNILLCLSDEIRRSPDPEYLGPAGLGTYSG